MLASLLVLRRRTFVVQGTKEEQGPRERKEDVTHVTRSTTMLENALIEGFLPGMMMITTRGMEIKEKLIIRDSIHKSLVAYISELRTSKEMYDKLVNMFKANNANQALLFKNQLKNLKKGRDESVQSY